PRPGEVMAIIASAVTPASPVTAPTIRSIVLNPGRYRDDKDTITGPHSRRSERDKRVPLTGHYSGRTLLGDLPAAPARSRYDFVMRSADAAIWVANMRPRLKDATRKDLALPLD